MLPAVMRIARVLTRLNLGGPAAQVLGSDPLLAERGHTVRVFAGTAEAGEGDLFQTAQRRGLDVRRVPGLARGLAPVGNLRAAAWLGRELAAFGPDLVHTHASKAGWIGRRAARVLPRTARVHTFHGHVLEGYFPAPVARRLVRMETDLARETDRIVAVSHATADDLVRLGVCTEDQLVVVPPGIDLAPFLGLPLLRQRNQDVGPLRRTMGAASTDVVVGVIGRLAPVKQPEVALAAFSLLGNRYRTLHMAFVGDGTERRALERAINALPEGVRERAHLLGAREGIASILAELDSVLLSSRTEGLPVALIEAGAAGLPVVAFGVGGVEELVMHERTGIVVAPDAGSDGLAFALAQLLEDRRGAAAMGERARLRVAARHGAPALADRLEAVYQSALEVRKCAS